MNSYKTYKGFGMEKTMTGWATWAKKNGYKISISPIRSRLKKGWSVEDTILTPVKVFKSMYQYSRQPEKKVSVKPRLLFTFAKLERLTSHSVIWRTYGYYSDKKIRRIDKEM